MIISEEDKELIVRFKQLLDEGKRANGAQVTQCYNRVFNSKIAPTNCSSCIRQRIGKLYKKLQTENGTDNK